MRPAEEWLSEYAKSHRNPMNKRIHYVCVPLIFWSVIAMLWPLTAPSLGPDWAANAAVLVSIAGLVFYASLGAKNFVLMLFPVVSALGLCGWMSSLDLPLFAIGAAVFVLAWIGQFIGHRIEGRKPSFLHDLVFLLIGPLWIARSAGGVFGNGTRE